MSCLAGTLGEFLRDNGIVSLLMPLLSRKWSQLQDNDRKLIPLFECFSTVIDSLGPDLMEPHVLPIYERCLNILQGIKDALE